MNDEGDIPSGAVDAMLEDIERTMCEISGVTIDPRMLGHTSGVDGSYAVHHLVMAAITRFRAANPYRYVGRAYDPYHPLMRARSDYISPRFTR